MPAKFTKGNRVEFDHRNEILYGVVSKGGSKTKVILDGGKLEYSVPVELLRASYKELAKDGPHPMDSWGLKSYSEAQAMSEETIAFTATVTKDGKDMLAARNDGRGGCNSYYPLSGGYATVASFEEDAKRWLMDHGMPEESCVEAGDMWLGWKSSQAPYGVTARAMVADWLETMDGLRPSSEGTYSPGMS